MATSRFLLLFLKPVIELQRVSRHLCPGATHGEPVLAMEHQWKTRRRD